MKVLKIAVAVVCILLVTFLCIGLVAPEDFQGEMTSEYRRSPEEIWKLLTDYKGLAGRRAEITAVQILGYNEKGHLQWKEFTNCGGFIAFEQIDSVPYQKLTVRILKSQFTMSGTWTYLLKPKPNGGTILTIKEVSSVEPIVMRTLMYLAGRNSFIKQEQRNLKRALL